MAGPTYTLLPGDIDGATLKLKVGVEGRGREGWDGEDDETRVLQREAESAEK